MSWREVLNLLEIAGGAEDQIDADKLAKAVVTGPGSPDVQLRIARRMYHAKYYMDTDNGQTRWEFG